MAASEFDRNIERVLENWTVAHAIRELIANALDEAALTGSEEPRIEKRSGGLLTVRHEIPAEMDVDGREGCLQAEIVTGSHDRAL